MSARRLNLFTWHAHGHYLYYLSQLPHDIYIPVKPGRPHGYAGRAGTFGWPDNLHEVPVQAVPELPLDCVIIQSHAHYRVDQHEVLGRQHAGVPRIVLEHDPPRVHPTDTRHPVDDPNVVLVHVTPFNALMWDSGRTPTVVIEHGVAVPEAARYQGHLPRGIAAVNGMPRRHRLVGRDIFERVRREIPIDLVGMESEAVGGLGEIKPMGLPAFEAPYRFFFHPIRYTSLGLAVCEAMAVGMPIVGLATTELSTVIRNGESGWIDTDVERLIGVMRRLLEDPELARQWGDGARRVAQQRFGLARFLEDWDRLLQRVADPATAEVPCASP